MVFPFLLGEIRWHSHFEVSLAGGLDSIVGISYIKSIRSCHICIKLYLYTAQVLYISRKYLAILACLTLCSVPGEVFPCSSSFQVEAHYVQLPWKVKKWGKGQKTLRLPGSTWVHMAVSNCVPKWSKLMCIIFLLNTLWDVVIELTSVFLVPWKYQFILIVRSRKLQEGVSVFSRYCLSLNCIMHRSCKPPLTPTREKAGLRHEVQRNWENVPAPRAMISCHCCSLSPPTRESIR